MVPMDSGSDPTGFCNLDLADSPSANPRNAVSFIFLPSECLINHYQSNEIAHLKNNLGRLSPSAGL
jgi:hypothetical protein